MSRGYRYAIFAAFGWLTLTAQAADSDRPPEQSAEANQAEARQQFQAAADTIASAIREAGKPPEPDRGCQKGQDRNSELCAQWKAADAAQDAARYALWSLLGTVVGTGLLIWTLWETRQTSRRELRAYVTVEPVGILEENDGSALSCMMVTNRGQTPAFNLNATAFMDFSDNPLWFKPQPVDRNMRIESEFTLGPGQQMHVFGQLREISLEKQRLIRDRKVAIMHYGVVFYRDAFGRRRETQYTNYFWGEELGGANARRSRNGNHAT